MTRPGGMRGAIKSAASFHDARRVKFSAQLSRVKPCQRLSGVLAGTAVAASEQQHSEKNAIGNRT